MRVVRNSLALLLVVITLGLAITPAGLAEDPQPRRSFGLLPSKGNLPTLDAAHRPNRPLQALSQVVDLSAGLPPVGDQGGQNSCVGWSLGYYYKTFQERRERNWDPTSSQHQFSPTWIYNQRSTSDCARDVGMSFYDGLSILQEKGAATLAALPYTSDDSCTQPSQAVKNGAWPYRAQGFANIFAGRGTADLVLLKNLLADGQPFALAVPIYSSFLRVSHSNPLVPRPAAGETLFGGHAMLVVGYDDTIGGFKAVNSWGAGWGRDGYAYLSYGFVQNDTWEAWVMTDYVEPASPSVFSGAISLDGQNAPQGAEVSAWIGDTRVATATVQLRDGVSVYALSVAPDNPGTTQREGGRAEDRVRFRLGTSWANDVGSWVAGRTQRLDLHVLVNQIPKASYTLYLPVALR